jgi:hypothetical protein
VAALTPDTAGLQGGCLCGRVRYRIAGALARAGHCHCSICRRAHGAAFATWALLAPGQLTWTAGAGELSAYASSPGRQRLFCRHCGAALAAAHDGAIGEVVLASVDGDPGVRPAEHIFVGSRACWDRIDDDLPQHDAWPPGIG